jgi:hypothetical protein
MGIMNVELMINNRDEAIEKGYETLLIKLKWIPAFAGMTVVGW